MALAKLPGVAVQLLAEVWQSSMPAISSSYLGTGTKSMPVPLGSGNEANQHRATVSDHLGRPCVGFANLVPLVASLHRDNGELGQDEGPLDGR